MRPESVTRTTLANGLTVLVHHEPGSGVAAIVTYVRAGYFDETDDIVGISHVVEHMFFKGTPTHGVGEIAQATKSAGGYLNAHTIYDHTSYYTVLPAPAFGRGLEIQADAYSNSLIEQQELARELEVIIQEAKRKADNPSAITTETLYELLHDNHRIRRWRIGREAGLRRLTRDDVHGFYRGFYQPSNTILTIAGGVEPDVALREVERLYGALRDVPVERTAGPREDGAGSFRYRELSGDVTQTRLAFGWRVPDIHDPAGPALDLAATALGSGRASRLYRAVRERQLASSVAAHNYTMAELGVFTVHLETEPATAIEAARATWGEVLRLRDERLPDHELERARRLYEARWLKGLESMEGRANFLASWEALGGWERGPAYLDRVRGATPATVRDAMQAHVQPRAAAVLAYRPATAREIASDADTLLRELEHTPFTVPAPRRPPTRSLPAPVRVELEREAGGVSVYRTARGVPILVRRRRGLAFAYMGAYASGGAVADPPERAGLTLLLARSAVKGTALRTAGEIAEEAESLGGTIAASSSGDACGWSMSVPLAATASALELLGDVVQRPVFDPAILETERAIAQSDLASLRDDMFSWPLRLMNQAAFGAHAYATPAAGTGEGLGSVTASDLRSAHQARFGRGSAVIAVVADAEPHHMARLAAVSFAELAVGEAVTTEPPEWLAGAAREESRDKAQTAIALGFPAPARRDPDRFAMELVTKVASGLGGRFFEELRDRRSLAYTVHAFTSARPLAGMFATYMATSPEQEEAAREGIVAEVRRLRDQPPTMGELERARQYAVGTELIRRESGSALLSEMIETWLFGDLEELDAYESAMRALTIADLERVILTYLDPARIVTGVVRGRGREV
ncbi:MAG TPA: pitrilysin family protein [Gemmatimonadaceae bacterium]|nr:pitrilysin family protein [Gemmatimonadaceae bacterium]